MRHIEYKSIIERSFSQHGASSGYIKQQISKFKPIYIHIEKNSVSVTKIVI